MDPILTFWGKARPMRDRPGPAAHPLAYHCLDVAAVADVLLSRHAGLRALPDALRLDRETGRRVLVFLLSLHDIGKFARVFQAKAPDRYPEVLGGLPARSDPGHGRLALLAWERCLEDLSVRLFAEPEGILPLADAVFGHHGRPVGVSGLAPPQDLFGKAGIDGARRFAEAMATLLLPVERPIDLDERAARTHSFAIAGFAVLCDWIGSNQQWFAYQAASHSLADYWSSCARPRADNAVAAAGILPAPSRAATGYAGLTGKDGFAPRPMQTWAVEVDLPPGPALFLIEDDTASGKTEASLMLAHRLIAAGRATGLYVALPTMATANAMFDRLSAIYRRLFAQDATPSLALAHSARDLHPGFRRADLQAGSPEVGYGGPGEAPGAEDVPASAACAEWIADDRRRTFLADVGVGTVEQALLAVLPVKHQSLRLLGLGQRVLILDEIHAYDAYMQQEIETLLRFHAAQGGSAVLLSATLSQHMRQGFVRAFRRGLGDDGRVAPGTGDRPYPLAAAVAPGVMVEAEVPPYRRRSVAVRLLEMPEAALAEVAQAARAGRAVVYIRNTVDDAIDATQALAAQGTRPLLFHARFTMGDRLAREAEVLARFGRDAPAEVRAGQVLVATQVVEQSLDLDFDLVVSDLAPIDLLIQRAGRLWRHARPRPPGACEMLVVSPEPRPDADREWLRRPLPRAAAVYRNHAQLWLSARELRDRGAIVSPDDLRAMIEAVYGDDADRGVPTDLRPTWIEAEGQSYADRSLAHQNVLIPEEGYVPGSGAWDDDTRTPTRLGEPETVLRLARLEDGSIVPWASGSDGEQAGAPGRAWRLSECRVRASQIAGEADWDTALAPLVSTAKRDWHRWESDKVLVPLIKTDNGWHGPADGPGGTRTVIYDPHLGLQVERDDGRRRPG